VWEHKRGGGRKYSNKKRREMKRTREPYFFRLQQYGLLSAVLGGENTAERRLVGIKKQERERERQRERKKERKKGRNKRRPVFV